MSQPLKEIQNSNENCRTPSTSLSLSTKSSFSLSQSFHEAGDNENVSTSSSISFFHSSPSISPILKATYNAENYENEASEGLLASSTVEEDKENVTPVDSSTCGGLVTSETLPSSSTSESSKTVPGSSVEDLANPKTAGNEELYSEGGASNPVPSSSARDVISQNQQESSGESRNAFINPVSLAVAVFGASSFSAGNINTSHTPDSRKTKTTCELCGLKTSKKSELEDHNVSVHGAEPPSRAFCHECSFQFCTNRQFRTHRLRTHEPQALRCTHCSKVYVREEFFARHLEMHLTQATCHNCSHVYCNRWSLRQHETTQKHQKNAANNTI